MARLCEGELKYAAQLDDYAFSALGFLELYRANFDPVHIISAAKQAEQITARFAAPGGGFYRTAQDADSSAAAHNPSALNA